MQSDETVRGPLWLHPARAVPLAFVLAILAGTAVLSLPAATAEGVRAPLVTALFTATSAICVTGLVVVDTGSYWSPFGQAAILLMFQLGGLGIMAGATLLGLLVSRRLPLSRRLLVKEETKSLRLSDVRAVVLLVLVVTLAAQTMVAAILVPRLRFAHGESWGEALWNGVFHAVSAFNNAGFSTYSDSLMRFALDPVILVPVMAAVILGGIGFPVLHELRERWREPVRWSVHAKITLLGSALLLILGFGAILATEWTNPFTLGDLPPGARALNAMVHSVMTRSGGFNTVDTFALRAESLLVSDMLMFVGAGSAGTGGGIKITTFFLLGFVVWAEIRGEPETSAFGRRIGTGAQRQALAVAFMAVLLVGFGTLALLALTPYSLDRVLFEVISAAATVGLSTGITPHLPPSGQVILVVLMYTGRVGTITVATALALRASALRYRYPEERPIVG
ncbi:TrkH family potassium uptake protein [Rubellimicrobium sp. CFH 75288]|nr:TrkH family potassium uptake protein [Rubellimicrobium sp. CFH 75288]